MSIGSDRNRPLSARQTAFVMAVLTSPTVEAASQTVGVSGRTGRSWMKDPRIRGAIQRERSAIIEASTNIMASATIDALLFLHSELKSKSAPHSAKMVAARVILQHSASWLELQDLAARVVALEEAHELEEARRTSGS